MHGFYIKKLQENLYNESKGHSNKQRFCHARICHNNEINNICEKVKNMFPESVRK